MRTREVDASGVTVVVREWGADDATPFVFWHSVGPGGSGATIAVAAEALAEAGFHVVAPDAPGFGRSRPFGVDGYGLAALAELLWDVAAATTEGPVVLAGHSWGGAVAVSAAGARPRDARALVLYDSGHCDYADWPDADLSATRESLAASASEDTELPSWEALVELLRDEGLDQPWTLDAWREAVDELPDGTVRLRCDPVARGAALYELTNARPSRSWPALAAAGVPTLLVLATEPASVADANERLVPAFEAAVPQARVVRPGCRHQVFADLGRGAGELTADWLLGLP